MGGEKPRTVGTRVSDQCARGAPQGEDSVIVEAVRTDHRYDAVCGKRDDCGSERKQDVDAEAVVEIDQVACGLFGVVLMRRATAVIVFAVMMMHDQFDMFAKVLYERRCALPAVHDVREITLRSSEGLPR